MATTYKWFFGDGTTGSGDAPSHIYTMPGVYTVSCEFYEDGVYQSTTTKQLQITVDVWNDSYGIDVSKTNTCYRFGVNSQEGIGCSEVYGDDWILPPGRVAPIRITDRDGVIRSIAFDNNDRLFYELGTTRGVESLGFSPTWRDKANVFGNGGTAFDGYIKFASNIGTLERFFVEMISCNVYTRPIQNELQGNNTSLIYDANGYPTGLLMEVTVGVDDNKPSVAQAKKINIPKHEIVFDRRVEGHQLQTTVKYNVAPILINGITENIMAKDKLNAPNLEHLHEFDVQQVIAVMQVWYSRGHILGLNRMTGSIEIASGDYSAIMGADGFSGSAMATNTPINISGGGVGKLVMWYRDDTPVNLSNPMTVYATLGNWVLASSNVASTGFDLPNGFYFDIRKYATVTNDMLEYIYNDVVDNHGNNIMPIWG